MPSKISYPIPNVVTENSQNTWVMPRVEAGRSAAARPAAAHHRNQLANLQQTRAPHTVQELPVPDTDTNEWLEGMCRGMDDAEWFLHSVTHPNAQADPASVTRQGRLERLRQAEVSLDFARECLSRFDQSVQDVDMPDTFILRGEAYTGAEITAHMNRLSETIRLMRATT